MRDMTTKVMLVIVAGGNALVGLWAGLAPSSFYDDFPGGGRHWIPIDGPYNEHLIRDVGWLNLALVALIIAVLLRPGRYLVQVAMIAELVYAVPHFVYHLTHLDGYESTDKVGLVLSLSVTVIVPIALLVRSSRASDEAITTVA